MESKDDIVFKPNFTPNQNWVKELDSRHMDSSLSAFRVPKDDKRVITFCKPFVVFSKNSYSSPVTLPLGLAYLGGVLEKAGYKTKIIDATGEKRPMQITRSADNEYNIQGLTAEQIIEKIDPNTYIFGISLMFSQEWVLHRSLIEKIKKKYPNMIIVAGGEHASAIPEYILRDCPSIDYVIKGEGEFSMLEFSHKLFNKKDVSNITGINFIDSNGKFKDNGLSKRIEHIDTLPRPAWHLLSPENYYNDYYTLGLATGRNMPILATRGCPFQCTFCSSPSMWTTRYVMRDPKEIVDEIEWLMKEYQANDFEFFDLTAIIKKSWIIRFCDEIKKRNLNNITWQLPVGTRTESLDKEVLQAIYDTGCHFVCYAPESGSQKSLDIIKKRVNKDRLVKSIRTSVKVGHKAKLNFIIGFPHETLLDCVKTILFGVYCAFRLGVSDILFSVFSPYPGSELFNKLEKEKKIKVDDNYFQALHAQFDFTKADAYCEKVSGRKLALLRLVGFVLCYATIYISRPKRILGLIKSLVQGKFFAKNLFEQRMYEFYLRFKQKKEQKIKI